MQLNKIFTYSTILVGLFVIVFFVGYCSNRPDTFEAEYNQAKEELAVKSTTIDSMQLVLNAFVIKDTEKDKEVAKKQRETQQTQKNVERMRQKADSLQQKNDSLLKIIEKTAPIECAEIVALAKSNGDLAKDFQRQADSLKKVVLVKDSIIHSDSLRFIDYRLGIRQLNTDVDELQYKLDNLPEYHKKKLLGLLNVGPTESFLLGVAATTTAFILNNTTKKQ